MKNTTVTIIAGPCSINEKNQEQLFEIAEMTVPTPLGEAQRPIWGIRVVGIKSRTAMNQNGDGMGIDFPAYTRNVERFMQGEGSNTFEVLPSVHIAEQIVRATDVVVATEIVDPLIQLPSYERVIPRQKLFIWNPAVNQLGHPAMVMGRYATRNSWHLGFKNGKWLGDIPESGMSTMEKSWAGLASYAMDDDVSAKDRAVMIHRGVDVVGKGNYRNLPVHDTARRVKEISRMKLFFDPSHSHGPTLKHRIVDETIDALNLRIGTDEYLYDGILIEAGDSTTDTDQHITISELRDLCKEIAKFRNIQSPGASL